MAENSPFEELFSTLNGLKVAGVVQLEADLAILAEHFKCRAELAPNLM